MTLLEGLPDLPRCHDLSERIRIILDRNPSGFPPWLAEPLSQPLRVVPDARTKPVSEHGGEVETRQLLDLDDDRRLVVCAGSFRLDDTREPASELDAPTILAWRLFEDLHELATRLEDELVDADGPGAPHVRERLRDERRLAARVAAFCDEVLATNPQFFPPWLVENLSQGVLVVDRAPEWDADALGFFEETEVGTRIVIVGPALLATADGMGEAWLARELVYTLCHEFEHHYGATRGYDPMADREDFFDQYDD